MEINLNPQASRCIFRETRPRFDFSGGQERSAGFSLKGAEEPGKIL